MPPQRQRDLADDQSYDSDAQTIAVSEPEPEVEDNRRATRTPRKNRQSRSTNLQLTNNDTSDSDPERGSKSKLDKPKRLTYEEFQNRSRAIHSKYLKEREESRWSNQYEYGRRFMAFWRKVWRWWFFRWFLRKFPYLLALLTIVAGGLIALTGPWLDMWAVEVEGVKYGAWGGCKDGGKGQCSTQIFYDGPKFGNWSSKTISVVLLCFGIVALLQLLFLLYAFLFIRHHFVQSCCTDPESLDGGSRSIRARERRASKWFERTMDMSSIGYLTLSLVLAGCVSESGAEGETGWDLSICLAISPFLWLFFRVFYRSRILSKASRRFKRGMDVVKNGPDSYPDSEYDDESDTESESDSGRDIVYSRKSDGRRIEGPNANRRRLR
ncbi:hypothetical protein I204_01327 [Kwoniella mangroviensis CBS 8886]|nr:hypothetical protein I204_01327 [Kwoniella mangroviensis CBS 8886]